MKTNMPLWVVLLVVLSSGCLGQGYQSAGEPGEAAAADKNSHTIKITDSGFSPDTIAIKKGDTVRWVNEDSEDHWPASAMHPTHKVYPGSGIEKCGTDEEDIIFDACGGIQSSNTWSFTFNEAGTWRYHDHLNVQRTGTVIVES